MTTSSLQSAPPVEPSGVVTLLTDLGIDDPSVAIIKGVVLKAFPEARLVDVSHSVPLRGIVQGAFWLARTYGWFPEGTVHLAVVEPAQRKLPRAVLVQAGDHYFLGPDNGLLSAAVEHATRSSRRPAEVREIDLGRFALGPKRAHRARSLFAPVAAELASGRFKFSEVGEPVDGIARSPLAEARKSAAGIEGEVVFVDHFGNLVTNVEAHLLDELTEPLICIEGREIKLRESYVDVDPGEYLALVNTFGTLEIARRDSDAASSLGVAQGAKVMVR
jgi:S-adenosylmethionine hydrolase